MKQADVQNSSRLDVARSLLYDSKLMRSVSEKKKEKGVTFFEFNDGAHLLAKEGIKRLKPGGKSTNFHQSIKNMLDSIPADQSEVSTAIF